MKGTKRNETRRAKEQEYLNNVIATSTAEELVTAIDNDTITEKDLDNWEPEPETSLPVEKEKAKPLELTPEQQVHLNSLKTTSARIRYLDSLRATRSQIALKLNKKYQHVRNVLTTPLKRVNVEVTTNEIA